MREIEKMGTVSKSARKHLWNAAGILQMKPFNYIVDKKMISGYIF